MPTSKKITDFVINKVPTKSIFNKMKEQGLINNDEIYLVEEDDSDSKYVSYESQSLTDSQKTQARNNIGALGSTDIVPINHGGTGGTTQDAARTNLGLPTQDKRLLNICSGTRLVSGSNITITLDPTEAKKYSSILIMLGTPLGGNYGNMYDSFVFPLSPDTWAFRFFKYTLEGQNWQCAKANLSSDLATFTITAVSGDTNNPCWCYLM